MNTLSTAERWKRNIPATDRPPYRSALGILQAVLISIALVAAVGELTTAFASGPQPEVIVFSTPGCMPCAQLKQDILNGALPGSRVVFATTQDPLYAEYLRTVTASASDLEPGRTGAIGKRPRSDVFPSVWVRGSVNLWVGYRSDLLPGLSQFIQEETQQLTQPQQQWRPTAEPRAQPMPAPAPMQPAPVQPDPDFDGVHVIVTIANLTTQMPEFRADVARRADRALSELVRQTIGDKAAARIIAEVADPKRFDAICRAAGVRPGANGIPVACQILIPERFSGLQGFIVKRVEYALNQHFLVPLQSAGINVVIERIHGETYGAVLDAATGNLDGSPTPLAPEHSIPFALSAWLAERSNLARRLLMAIGLVKA